MAQHNIQDEDVDNNDNDEWWTRYPRRWQEKVRVIFGRDLVNCAFYLFHLLMAHLKGRDSTWTPTHSD